MPKTQATGAQTNDLELSKLHRMTLDLLQDKQNMILQQALGEQVAAFHRQLEEDLGLPEGAINTTHLLNPQTYTVERIGAEGNGAKVE